MTIYCFNCTADNRRVDKNGYLSPASIFDGYHYTSGTLRNETDVEHPVIRLAVADADVNAFNYIQISEWSKYYWVVDRKVIRDGLLEITCKEDVLYTFKSSILALTAYVARNETNTKPYMDDPKRVFSSDHTFSVYPVGATYQSLFGVSGMDSDTFLNNVIIMSSAPAVYSMKTYTTPPTGIVNPALQFIADQMTHVAYAIDRQNLGRLFAILNDKNFWTSVFESLFSSQNADGIIEILNFPFSLASASYGGDVALRMYNNDIGLTGYTQPKGKLLYTNSDMVFDFGTITPVLSGDFRDFEPYSKATLYLPYIGFTDIPMRAFRRSPSLHIYYIVSVTTGKCTAIVRAGNEYLKELQGEIGVKVPITSSNALEVRRNQLLTGIGLLTSLPAAAANPAAGIVSAAGSIAASASMPYTMHGQAAESYLSRHLTPYPYVLVEKATDLTPTNYGKYIGYPRYTIGALSTYSGYTVVEEVFSDLTNATARENEEVISLLKSGVIL